MNERAAVSDFPDADSTNQLPRADSTLADLPAMKSADATGEITLDDVIEVISVKKGVAAPVSKAVSMPVADPTMSAVFGAITPKKLREVLAPLRANAAALDPNAPPAPPPPPNALAAHPTAPALTQPPVEVPAPTSERAPSYAGEPVAYDIAAPPASSSEGRSRGLLESTAELRWFAESRPRIPWQHVVTGFAGAIVFSILGLFTASRLVTASPASAGANDEPRRPSSSVAVAAVAAATSNVPAEPVQTPQAAALPAVTVLQAVTIPPSSTADPMTPVSDAAAVSAPRMPKGRSTKANAPVVRTGQVAMPSGVNAALVDGAPKKVVNGKLTLTCGLHKVKVAGHSAKTTYVPCGGVASL